MIKIIVCGDFRARAPEMIHISGEVNSLFANADIRICNFEGPVHTDGVKPMKKSGPSLDQSIESPDFLIKNGFNVILLANNHIMDYGEVGLQSTLNSFKDVITVGAGKGKDAFSVRYFMVKSVRVGICTFVQKEFGTVDSKDDCTFGAAWINSFDVPGIISESRKHCDFLIVLPHAGVEHTIAPLPEWRSLYKRFIDWGADAVVGGHPHCPQGWEWYKGKPIYYSLGDFYFDELTHDDLWYKSIVVEFCIGDTIGVKEHFICFDDKTGCISIDRSERIREHTNKANELLHNDTDYNKYINRMCAAHWAGIRYGLLRGLCGVSLEVRFKLFVRLLGCMLLGNKDEPYLLNALQCESHRWLMERHLKNNLK